MTDEASKTLWMLFKAWCRERDLDHKDDVNMKQFLDETLP